MTKQFPQAFTYQALPMRVRFGEPAFDVIAEELSHLGLRKVVVLCSPGRVELGQLLAGAIRNTVGTSGGDSDATCAGVIAKAVMHVPREVAEETIAEVKRLGADGCVSIGGGSAIDAAKGIIYFGQQSNAFNNVSLI